MPRTIATPSERILALFLDLPTAEASLLLPLLAALLKRKTTKPMTATTPKMSAKLIKAKLPMAKATLPEAPAPAPVAPAVVPGLGGASLSPTPAPRRRRRGRRSGVVAAPSSAPVSAPAPAPVETTMIDYGPDPEGEAVPDPALVDSYDDSVPEPAE